MATTKKRKPQPAKKQPESITAQLYKQVATLNCEVQYTQSKQTEELNVFPRNEKAERVTFRQQPLTDSTIEVEMYVIRKGETFHNISVVIERGSKTQGSVLALAKSELRRLC